MKLKIIGVLLWAVKLKKKISGEIKILICLIWVKGQCY